MTPTASEMSRSSATAAAGKTQLLSTLLFDAGAVNRLGRVDDGTVGDRLRRRSDRPQAHARVQPRLRRVEQDQDQLHRHAGHRQFPERRARGAAGRRRGAGGRRRGRRRRGLDREDVGRGRGARAAAAHRPQPAGPRARQPRALARVAARRVRPDGHPDPAADRRGEGLPRRRRPRVDEGLDLRRPTRSGKADRGRRPGRPRERRRSGRAKRSSRWSPRPTMR